ncbi:MAG: sulfurtransferase TusE [Rhodocyclaceae bacterium]|nr:MAG: sulfurtransferase TusE [Rhodocyclaceae bacterium]
MVFPHAPEGWSASIAEDIARAEGIELTADHWEAVRGLQEYFVRHEGDPIISLRELHDALDERFHSRGGIRSLYLMFPGGPIAQGCRIAGLKAPYLSKDLSFGSVS